MNTLRYFACVGIYLFTSVIQLRAQVVINEFSGANATVIADEKGDYPDWIELYNPGSTSVNLLKYALSDDPILPGKWRFPNVIIAPNAHLVIMADGASKSKLIHHWETAVKSNDIWSYHLPTAASDTNWRNVSFSDISWGKGKGGFGYGDGDDSTVISTSRTVYLRKKVTISDTSQIVNALLNIDYDDGFVAYLNGVEIARANLGTVGDRPAYNELAKSEHEAVMYQGGRPDSFLIENSVLRNLLLPGTNVLAIEVHNASNLSTDLSAIPFLSFGVTRSNYVFPAPPAWFRNSIRDYLHCNFKLSKSGETILLSDSNNTLIDQKYTGVMQTDVSYGRSSDGATSWCYFAAPTPNSSNSLAACYAGVSNLPVFSIDGGFYPGTRMLSLSASPANSIIRYTTDGSNPTSASPIYTSSLLIDTTQTVKARVYSPGLIPSQIVTNTYFIDEDFHLPVISLSTNPDNLWNDTTGIYVLGNNASPNYPYKGANYWQDWEKPVSVEYYDKQKNKVIQFDAGFKINGNYSRTKPQKSFEVMLDNEYGISEFTYPLIPEKKNISSYNNFILRNAGTDWNKVHYRDGLMQRIMKDTYTGYLGYEPCDVFLNGRFWGVYEIRQNDNFTYVEKNFGYKKSEIDLLFEGGGVETKNGSDTGFFNIYNYALTANTSDSSFYERMNAAFDLQNYADYFIAETYYVNNDWIGDWSNNIKLWRPRAAGGKWKYILYDLDFGMGLYSSYTTDKLSELIAPVDNCYQSDLFNAMVANPIFKNYFINRYADLINTIYYPANVRKIAYQMRDSIAMDMPQQFARWGGSDSSWAQNIAGLINFTNKRPQRALNHIESNFNLNGQVVLTLDAQPAGAGRIQISTIVPDSLPWKGTYFKGNPVSITAIPNPGYAFDHWGTNNSISATDSTQTIRINFTSSDSVVAYFTGSSIVPHITFSEINYQSSDSADAGDWVEFHNPDSVDIDLSGWKFRDNDDLHTFTFPLGTVIEANSHLVLAEDLAKFDAIYEPDQIHNHHGHSDEHHSHRTTPRHESFDLNYNSNVIGPLSFAFSNSGELLRLYDYRDSLHVSMTFSKLPPWPILPAGQGYTLESINNNPDLDNGDNWFAGCIGGSPATFYTPAIANILADSVVTICEGDSVQLSASVGNAFKYQWLKDGQEMQDANSASILIADSGAYQVRIKRIGCESISSIVKVKIVSKPNAHIQSPAIAVVCEGSLISLLADSLAGQNFSWYKNDTLLNVANAASISVADSGYYFVVVSDNSCSKKSQLIEVEEHVLPLAELIQDSLYSFCSGNYQLLHAPSVNGYSYQWLLNDSLLAGANDSTFAAYAEGEYSFITSANSCSKRSPSIHIELYDLPKTFVQANDSLAFCYGGNGILQAYSDSTYLYQWFKNDTLLVGADSSSLQVDAAGSYILKVQNANCTVYDTVQVVFNSNPTPVIAGDSNLVLCAGTSYQLKVAQGISYTYQWMKDSTILAGATNYKYIVSDSGKYSVVVNLGACQGHSNTIQVSIHALPQSEIFASDTTSFCENESVYLFSSSNPEYTYQWYKNGSALLGQNDTGYTATQSGNYTLVTTDSLCLKASNAISVSVKPLPDNSIGISGSTHLCSGDSVLLSAYSGINYNYQWYKNGAALGLGNAQLLLADSGFYSLRVELNNCFNYSDTFKITQNRALQAIVLSADTVSICAGSTYTFAAQAPAGVAYLWYLNSQVIPFASDSIYQATSSGAYMVEVVDSTCSARSSQKVLQHFAPILVSLSSFAAVCEKDSAFELSGGMPAGGQYSGNGVNGLTFYPDSAGVGNNVIYYSVTDTNQCVATANSIIEVKDRVNTPLITQQFNQLQSSAASGNQWYLNDTLLPGATQATYVPLQNGMYSVIVSDAQLCNSDPGYFSFLSLGKEELSNLNDILLYPNPGNGLITLQLPTLYSGKLTVVVTNVLGELVFLQSEQVTSVLSKSIDLRSLNKGVYFIQVNTGIQNEPQKLIVK
ncbi:MAG TPA: CotH kinase family protein [Bacteroidia bacterium]|nr:CotH kinase family protein [Bacteroidia bacterium]